MAKFEYRVVRLNDKELMSFVRAASEVIGNSKVSVQILGAARPLSFNLSSSDDSTLIFLEKSEDFSIYNFSISITNFSMSLSRTADADAEFGFDRLSINNSPEPNQSQSSLSAEQIQVLNHVISESLLAKADKIAPLFLNSNNYKTLLRSHQRMVEKLQQATTTVGEHVVEARLHLENEFAARKSKLEEEYGSRQKKVAETLEAGESALRRRQEELDEWKKNLDDRGNTFARRDLHQELKSKIAERSGKFHITPETKRNRYPIHLAVILTALVMLAFLYVYVSQLTSMASGSSTSVLMLLAIKPVGLTIALLALMAWYLRWMNRWFERYADTEFHLKQFDLDIDRASWVVEAALEWRLHQDKPMPEHLLETISRNLFSKSEKDESADMHPADYLASAILGRASAVNLKVPGGEISLTGQGIKKLQKDDVQA
ncbi:hypothetical protein [Mesorhizobium sp.]|uniref:hypothetical protein n=1 Tax=Mesorhizobium sp. TaxID=1871066 RepID=UPI000FE8089E|nr:hypothetical protein [Mesorhizobium sp.]RWO53691.1 MAG: hypothetical protein EOS13_10135 [Mesorhizobium sp.]